jgi:tripeptide aminopeptidase
VGVFRDAHARGLRNNAGFACSPLNAAVAPTPDQVRPAVDKAYTQLMAAPAIQKLLDAVKADHERAVDDMKMLTEIEAPPFKRAQQGRSLSRAHEGAGPDRCAIDAEGNVVGLRKGTGNGPTLLISAHLDTVFPAGTDVKVKEHDGKLWRPASRTTRAACRCCCRG